MFDLETSGNLLLVLVFLLCGFAGIYSAAGLLIGNSHRIARYGRAAIYSSAAAAVTALALLTWAFVTDAFSLAVVASHSASDMSVFYKIAAVWAGAEGSLMLWWVLLLLSMVIWAFANRRSDSKLQHWGHLLGSAVCIGFTAMLLFLAMPFELAPITIDQGNGLNPLLLNPWMISHPPLLFIGYAAFVIPFVSVLSGIFAGQDTEKILSRSARKAMLFGFLFLGLGILTGSKWAYVVLGWGGYWAWDPVENASLLPWLLAAAALHGLIGWRFRMGFQRWSMILFPAPFVLSLVATFVTRSGLLQSVHAFGQSKMSWALLGFLIACTVIWIIASVFGIKRSPKSSSSQDAFGRKDSLLWSVVVMVFTGLVILVATFWPLVSGAGQQGLTRGFYDKLISVIAPLLLGLLLFYILFESRKSKSKDLLSVIVLASGLFAGAVSLLIEPNFFRTITAALAFSAIAAIIFKLIRAITLRTRFAGHLSHLGLVMIIAAVAFATAEQSFQQVLKKDQPFEIRERQFVYREFLHEQDGSMLRAGPLIEMNHNGRTVTLWPHNRIHTSDRVIAQVAISTGPFQDVYLIFDAISKGQIIITIKIIPAMLWLWVGGAIMSLGIFLAMFEKRSS